MLNYAHFLILYLLFSAFSKYAESNFFKDSWKIEFVIVLSWPSCNPPYDFSKYCPFKVAGHRIHLLQLTLLSKTISVSTCKDRASDIHQFNKNLKAQCHEMDIFWVINILSVYFLCMLWWFHGFSSDFHCAIIQL